MACRISFESLTIAVSLLSSPGIISRPVYADWSGSCQYVDYLGDDGKQCRKVFEKMYALDQEHIILLREDLSNFIPKYKYCVNATDRPATSMAALSDLNRPSYCVISKSLQYVC